MGNRGCMLVGVKCKKKYLKKFFGPRLKTGKDIFKKSTDLGLAGRERYKHINF